MSLYGIAYRHGPTAWRLAPYPFRATVQSAAVLMAWLRGQPQFAETEMKIAGITFEEIGRTACHTKRA